MSNQEFWSLTVALSEPAGNFGVSDNLVSNEHTEAQARRGEAVYFDTCVRCHGPALMGGNDGAGALIGPAFNGNWNGVPLGQMVERMRATMPQDKPNSLTRQQTATC